MESRKYKTNELIHKLIGDLPPAVESGAFRLFVIARVEERLQLLGRRSINSEESRRHPLTEVPQVTWDRLKRQAEGHYDTKRFHLAVAAQMRRLLSAYARRRSDSGLTHSRNEVNRPLGVEQRVADNLLLKLHETLENLEQDDRTLVEACELYYFGGYTRMEISMLLDMPEPLLNTKLRLARAITFLNR